MRWRRMVATVPLLLVCAATPTLADPVTRTPTARPDGCDPARPAIAYYSGGVVLSPQPRNPPVPCGVSTGFAGAESHIVVLNDGAVVFVPAVQPAGLAGTNAGPVPIDPNTQTNASPAGLALSADAGAHWAMLRPAGITWNPTDHSIYVDPVTGRLFFEDYSPDPQAPALGPNQSGPAHLLWSGDGGRTWHYTVINEVALPENPRFASAIAPAGQPRPTGYPDVVYFCANTNVGFTSPVIGGRLCFKSMDGGSTFSLTSLVFDAAAPRHPECGANPESYSAIDGDYPEPASDGSLYLMVTCGSNVYLARSVDEAASFPVMHRRDGSAVTLPAPAGNGVTGGAAELRVDPADNLYLMWARGAHLMLAVSRDRGLSWNTPVDVTRPGLGTVLKWSFAERGIGRIAVAYLGQRPGQVTVDGYLTESTDVLARHPVFWAGMLNQPDHPLLYGSSIQGAGYLAGPGGTEVNPAIFGAVSIQLFGNDFIGSALGPDGTPWASFDADCGATPQAAGCRADGDQTRGFAGRLVTFHSTSPPVAPPSGPEPGTGGTALPATGGPLAVPVLGLVLLSVLLAGGLLRRRPAPRGYSRRS
ncbi:MAG TPA: sialidase family protein [Mycobacteriales bacterium]|nr:sialidase family protein [Mycobacteriales bacterium]